jgi:hypothetical protein
MPHVLNASSSSVSCPILPNGSSHVDANSDSSYNGGRGVRKGKSRLGPLTHDDGNSSSSSSSSNSASSNSRLEDDSSHDDGRNNRYQDDDFESSHQSSHVRDTSSHDSVTSQTSTTNIITPFAQKCPGKDVKSLNHKTQLQPQSQSEPIPKQGSEEEQRMPLQEKHLSIQEKIVDNTSIQKAFVHGNDDTTSAAVSMISLCVTSSAAIAPSDASATGHNFASNRTNAVTPVTHGMKRKRDMEQMGMMMGSGDCNHDEEETQEPSPTAYQTPLAPRMATASPHSDGRVHPITTTGAKKMATANTYAEATSHEKDTANTLTKVARFHQDNASWSKTPSLVAGSLSSSSWYTPNAGQPSTTPRGFYSGALHPAIYYPEQQFVVVGGSANGAGGTGGGIGRGGNMNGDGTGATRGYTNKPFGVRSSAESFVPNSPFYTPHRMSTQFQSFHHGRVHHPASQEVEGNQKDMMRDQQEQNTEQEKVANRFSSNYSPYPQTPSAPILNGTGTTLSSNIPLQQYHGYYFPPPPPISAMHPPLITSNSQLNELSMQYQTSYNPRMPLANAPNSSETVENESEGDGDKGFCLHNCDRVLIAKSGFVPDKVFPKDEEADAYDVKIPPFQQLVNYPHSSQRKRWGEEMRCVMCGEKHFTSHSRRLAAASQIAGSPESEDMYIIPKQNKGLCTACDNSVWKIRKTGKEIKWCKGCKNFKAWEAFGEKYLATKCVKCREKQKEKYARKTGKLGGESEGSAKKESPSSSSKSKRNEKDLFFVTGQRKGGNPDQGLSVLIAASNRVSEQD